MYLLIGNEKRRRNRKHLINDNKQLIDLLSLQTRRHENHYTDFFSRYYNQLKINLYQIVFLNIIIIYMDYIFWV